jgi:transposase-like protein
MLMKISLFTVIGCIFHIKWCKRIPPLFWDTLYRLPCLLQDIVTVIQTLQVDVKQLDNWCRQLCVSATPDGRRAMETTITVLKEKQKDLENKAHQKRRELDVCI